MSFLDELATQSHSNDGPAVCPGCKQALQPSELGSSAIQRCAGCNGVWMGFEAFDAVPGLPAEQLESYKQEADSGFTLSASRSPRQCPNCNNSMINFHFRSQVWLDWCEEGHGMWLDRGELALVHQIRDEAQSLSAAESNQLKGQIDSLKGS